ncbi:unnamed protein product [Thlaspi arvense]|uniref:Uncharacterized protein n=1 Tax=Thlaspi arvense TaxID=13288 RepID=A0AAU9T101_THLAR|nr:unnamed protein product [Thlaspi arvense]
MQYNSSLMTCNYSNRDITTDARTGRSSFSVQDIDTVLTNRYGVNVDVDDTFSLLYHDLYLRELKETLKHTMLVHESVFESQIHELHRLYWRQKELMLEMERTRRHEALYLNSTFPSLGTHWMNPSVSTYQTRSFVYEDNILNRIEAADNVEKSEKVVVDLELPVFECSDREVERGLMNGEVHKVATFLKEQSVESGNQLSKLQFDLNEPAKIEEDSGYVFNQFLSPPVTSNETGEKKNEVEDSVKGSDWMNEAQGQQSSVKCRGGHGIDLNMSPLSFEEEVDTVEKFETEKPQECVSVSLHGKLVTEQSRVVVQALPCLNSILLLKSSRPRKKVKHGPINKAFKGSDLDLRSTAEATSESQSDQATMRKGSSSSLSKVKPARNRTGPGKKRRCKPQVKSSNGHKVVAKKKRKKSRKISLVTEGNYQEISAAEAIVDMSRKFDRETSDCIAASLGRNLLWLAEISSSVVEDQELECSEAMTLQLTEVKPEDHRKVLRTKSADNKTAVSSIVLRKQRRSRTKRKCKDNNNQSLGTFSECEADEVTEKLVEVSESKWGFGFPKNKSRSSSPRKPIEAFISDWGAITKRRRGSRTPAAAFQHMIIDHVV